MNRTELVFILDMSGSMEHLTSDTIGGFNSVLKEQAAKEGEVLVTTYLFNNDCRMIKGVEAFYGVPASLASECRKRLPDDMIDILERFATAGNRGGSSSQRVIAQGAPGASGEQ